MTSKKNYSLYDADECYDDDVKVEIVIIIILFVFKSKLQIWPRKVFFPIQNDSLVLPVNQLPVNQLDDLLTQIEKNSSQKDVYFCSAYYI